MGEYKPHFPTITIFWRIIHIIIGVVLVWLPWTKAWENNLVLYFYPQIEPIVLNAFFKGAVLGLGIDNILVGIHDVIHAKFRTGYKSENHFS